MVIMKLKPLLNPSTLHRIIMWIDFNIVSIDIKMFIAKKTAQIT